jgi:hypothetical protein
MRLRIFALPRFALFFAGMLPSLTWCAFHPVSVLYRREDFFWVCGIGVILGILFSILVRRGFFFARVLLSVIFLAGIGVAFLSAVLDRDFGSLGIALGAFFVFVGVMLWLERRIASAALNPGHVWFEGELRLIPGLTALIRDGELSRPARVRSVDPDGFFLFFDQPFSFRPNQRLTVEMSSAHRKIEGEARVSAHFSGEKMGLGLQFLPKDLYHFGDYSALVQELRGRGL